MNRTPSTLTKKQKEAMRKRGIPIVETAISAFHHEEGSLREIAFSDGTTFPIGDLYSGPESVQHCSIPEQLGCKLSEGGLLEVDAFQQTTVPNVFACGDNASRFRALTHAIAAGTTAGAIVNNDMARAAF